MAFLVTELLKPKVSAWVLWVTSIALVLGVMLFLGLLLVAPVSIAITGRTM